MSDPDAAIRTRLDEYDDSMTRTGSLWGADEMRNALLAVLVAHERDSRGHCTECRESGPGHEAESVPYPCPTVLAIAEKLGVET